MTGKALQRAAGSGQGRAFGAFIADPLRPCGPHTLVGEENGAAMSWASSTAMGFAWNSSPTTASREKGRKVGFRRATRGDWLGKYSYIWVDRAEVLERQRFTSQPEPVSRFPVPPIGPVAGLQSSWS